MLGHASAAITLDRYSHVIATMQEEGGAADGSGAIRRRIGYELGYRDAQRTESERE